MNQKASTVRSHGNPKIRKYTKVFVPVIVVLLIAFSFVNFYLSTNRDSIPDEIEGLIVYEGLQSEVVNGPVEYDVIPPAGGAHAPTTLECGIYRIPVEDEQAVAALATGAVWIAYDPGLSGAEIDGLKDFAEGDLDIFMTPYPGLPHPIVITAWGYQLYPDASDDVRIGSFMRDFKDADTAPYQTLRCLDGVQVP